MVLKNASALWNSYCSPVNVYVLWLSVSNCAEHYLDFWLYAQNELFNEVQWTFNFTFKWLDLHSFFLLHLILQHHKYHFRYNIIPRHLKIVTITIKWRMWTNSRVNGFLRTGNRYIVLEQRLNVIKRMIHVSFQKLNWTLTHRWGEWPERIDFYCLITFFILLLLLLFLMSWDYFVSKIRFDLRLRGLYVGVPTSCTEYLPTESYVLRGLYVGVPTSCTEYLLTGSYVLRGLYVGVPTSCTEYLPTESYVLRGLYVGVPTSCTEYLLTGSYVLRGLYVGVPTSCTEYLPTESYVLRGLYVGVPTSCTEYLPTGYYVYSAIWRQVTVYSLLLY